MTADTDMAPVITIDGPGGSGKGTLTGMLAARLGWNLLDSGALYRVLAFAAGNHGVDLADEQTLTSLAAHLDVRFLVEEDQEQRIILEGEDVTRGIRTETAGAAHPVWLPCQPFVRRCWAVSRPSARRPGWSPMAAIWVLWCFPMPN